MSLIRAATLSTGSHSKLSAVLDMTNPKNLIHHLNKHWEIITALARASLDLPAFEEQQVLRLISKHHPELDSEAVAAILRTLRKVDLLQLMSRTSHLQLNPLVQDFVRGLTHEHELGLSSVLKARVDAICQATAQLADGLQARDHDQMRRGATRLSELFRQITQQMDQDRHAILGLAEQAKANDAAMPIARRYQIVLDAYDQYVEPINEIMDSGPAGTFYRYLEDAERTLDAATDALSVQGGLYTHRQQLRHVAYQAKELRRFGRVVAQQCADTLLPLRGEVRLHNELSAAISRLLGRVRKRGLYNSLRARQADTDLPRWRVERGRRVGAGDEIRTLMAEARNFTPKIEVFPEELPGDPPELSAWVDEAALRHKLHADLPVPNLMVWLQQHYPLLPDPVLLRLYHDVVREPDWQACLQAQHTTTALQHHRVHYYPHRLEPQP